MIPCGVLQMGRICYKLMLQVKLTKNFLNRGAPESI